MVCTPNTPCRPLLPRSLGAAVVLLGAVWAGSPATFAAGAADSAAPAAAVQQAPAASSTPSQPAGSDAQQARPLEISHVRWDYQNTAFFKRISEYFTNVENTGHRLILRTQPENRDGLYFQARLSRPASALPAGTSIEVTFLSPDSQTPVRYRFTIPTDGTDTDKEQLWLGFTGEDAPKDEKPPVAWQIRALGANGEVLAGYDSFLWSRHDNSSNAD